MLTLKCCKKEVLLYWPRVSSGTEHSEEGLPLTHTQLPPGTPAQLPFTAAAPEPGTAATLGTNKNKTDQKSPQKNAMG